MSVLDEREQGFEKRHALDEELRFKSLARRNKMLGLWVAEQIGLEGEEARAYANALVEREVGQIDDESLARTLGAALAGGKQEFSAHRIRRKIEATMALAVQEIAQGR